MLLLYLGILKWLVLQILKVHLSQILELIGCLQPVCTIIATLEAGAEKEFSKSSFIRVNGKYQGP